MGNCNGLTVPWPYKPVQPILPNPPTRTPPEENKNRGPLPKLYPNRDPGGNQPLNGGDNGGDDNNGGNGEKIDCGDNGIGAYIAGFFEMEKYRKELVNRQWPGADKFYHCLAHCETARKYGRDVAAFWGASRELSDIFRHWQFTQKGRDWYAKDVEADIAADRAGINAPSNKSCVAACMDEFRPPPLSDGKRFTYSQ